MLNYIKIQHRTKANSDTFVVSALVRVWVPAFACISGSVVFLIGTVSVVPAVGPSSWVRVGEFGHICFVRFGARVGARPCMNCKRCAHPAEAGQGSDDLRPATGDGIEIA